MNIQGENGIGWTKVPRWNKQTGKFYRLPGATLNPMAGCFHGCQWESIDGGVIAECYAKGVAEGLATKAYPHGFKHHYWYPERLIEPLKKQKPHGIFVGSMGDMFGAWVPSEQITQVLDMMRLAHWHTFLVLTKNPKRLAEFNPFPPNVWVGMSLPVDGRNGQGTAIFHDLAAMKNLKVVTKNSFVSGSANTATHTMIPNSPLPRMNWWKNCPLSTLVFTKN